MYLKALEILGFKSFADKTRLTFEPGMIAIVGPNGCGKSNVSDAIRWVLGEQRPSALRCGKMQDLIFNGTDTRKPLGMTEVSLLFADCESALGTDYNEVTVTRRAYRSGENQYFLNKTPCRLKDIQRLFMGTGVGTTSYSVMAQGQIDAILSSRPEDRRAVFEEAAGVTKFKADRKEALRKIQQTEENLTRLADILRELRRQSTLLRNQAEKAEQARHLRSELRTADLTLSRRRLAALETVIADSGVRLAEAVARIEAIGQSDAADAAAIAAVNARITEGEDTIARLTEAMTASAARHTHAQDRIRTNLSRIDEYRNWSVGLEREIAAAREQIEKLESEDAERPDLDAFADEEEAIRDILDAAQEVYDDRRAEVEEARAKLQAAHDGLAECDRRQAYSQQILAKADAGREERILMRGRLQAECDEALRLREERAAVRDRAEGDAEAHRLAAEEAREALILLDEDRSFVADDLCGAKSRQETLGRKLAALNARKEMLSAQPDDDRAALIRRLMTAPEEFGLTAEDVLGPLADVIEIPLERAKAAEAALGPWSEALVLRGPEAVRTVLGCLPERAPDTTLRLLAAGGTPPSSEPLPFGIRAKPGFEGLVARLLSPYTPVSELPELPYPDTSCVTDAGELLCPSGDGARVAAAGDANPLARRIACARIDSEIAEVDSESKREEETSRQLASRLEAIALKQRDTQRALEKAQREAALADGAYAAAARDAEAAGKRHAEVSAKLEEIIAETRREDEAREQARTALDGMAAERERHAAVSADLSVRLGELERAMDEASSRLSEARYRMVGFTQKREHALARLRDCEARLNELRTTIIGREDSIRSCLSNIERLEDENLKITGSLDGMEAETLEFRKQLEAARADRLALNAERERLEAKVAESHRLHLEAQEAKNRAEVALAEDRLRHTTLTERLATEYMVDPTAPDTWNLPELPEGGTEPADSVLESTIATLRADLDRIGPVNFLAIDEYKAIEERYEFTKTQEADLIASRDELLELIRDINETSGKMFRETFEKANANFETMFTRLFHGGEAKLVLLENAEDPLECGIDIIARPPGKKPQTISLLSGGERTMTAVSLLFAIFLIKPAPFCLLDELDAALDDSNIGRFVSALKDFLVHSQFLIITHNQHTIAGSDIVYGVTMPEKGVSKTLSMRFKKEA